MKIIFLIETDPIIKQYFSDVHFGYINEVNNVKDAQHYNSYDEAHKRLTDIIKSDYESKKTLYLSIVDFIVKN